MRFFVLSSFVVAIFFLAACSRSETSSASRPEPSPEGKKVRVSAEGKSASEVNIASASDGRIFVVWSERDKNKKYDIFAQEYSSDLEPMGQAVRVNPTQGEARTWSGDAPTILVAPDGIVYVGWNRIYADRSAGNDLMLSASTDGGKSFGEPLKINDDIVPASHGMHGMTLDSQGRVLISWLDERYLKAKPNVASNGHSTHGSPVAMLVSQPQTPSADQAEPEEPDAELYFAIVSEGKLVGPNQRIATEICPCCRVSLATADDGTIYIVYRKVFPGEFRHIAVSTSSDGGTTFSNPVQVSDDKWKLFACPVTGAALRIDGGDLQVVWYSGGGRGEKGLYRTVSSDHAKTFSPAELVSKTVLKGSPDFAGSEVVFGDLDRIYRGTDNSISSIAEGTTPSAVLSGDQVVTAFASQSGEMSAVWILK